MRGGAGFGRIGAFLLGSLLVVCVILWLGPSVRADDDAAGGGNKKIAQLIALGHQFIGTASCTSCHGNPAAAAGAPLADMSESSVWSTLDKHHEAYTTLSTDESKAIATKGGYGDPTTSTKCLACHSLDVPDAQRGPAFKLSDGVSCEACHGPAELWSGSDGSPHKTKGWAEKRREADGYDPRAQAKVDGFWDVRMPGLRAENCASCHLAIDAKMITAGHPMPAFELNEYAYQEPAHWTDRHSDQFTTQLWAAGQIVCTRDAMAELAKRIGEGDSADLITDEYNQAMAHATMLQILTDDDNGVGSDVKAAVDTDMTALTAAAGDATKMKDPATDLSTQANTVLTNDLSGFAPDANATGSFLTKAMAAEPNLAKLYGRRGAEQAVYAARWLYLSKTWDTDAQHVLPDDLIAEYKGFFTDRAQPLGDDEAKFADVITKIQANP